MNTNTLVRSNSVPLSSDLDSRWLSPSFSYDLDVQRPCSDVEFDNIFATIATQQLLVAEMQKQLCLVESKRSR